MAHPTTKPHPTTSRQRVVSIVSTLLVVIVIGAIIRMTGCAGGGTASPFSETVTVGDTSFELELAIDVETRTRGLMGRESIPDRGGMLFVFPDTQRRAFWMGNCLVDIDILFLDGGGRVTAIHRMTKEVPRADNENDFAYRARMPDYPSNYPAQFAIELRAGWLDRLGIRVQDRIPLDLQRLKQLAQ